MEFKKGSALRPPSTRRIAKFEKDCGISLPPDYVQVLKQHNGAIPLTNVFNQGRRERLIERILCLLDDPNDEPTLGCYDIDVVISQVGARLSDNPDLVGSRLIPIAELFAGDMVCLNYRKNPAKPAIVVWDHEQSDDFRPHLEKIADSFGEFTRLLRRSK